MKKKGKKTEYRQDTTISGRPREHGPKNWKVKQKNFARRGKRSQTMGPSNGMGIPIPCIVCGKYGLKLNSITQCPNCAKKAGKRNKRVKKTRIEKMSKPKTIPIKLAQSNTQREKSKVAKKLIKEKPKKQKSQIEELR